MWSISTCSSAHQLSRQTVDLIECLFDWVKWCLIACMMKTDFKMSKCSDDWFVDLGYCKAIYLYRTIHILHILIVNSQYKRELTNSNTLKVEKHKHITEWCRFKGKNLFSKLFQIFFSKFKTSWPCDVSPKQFVCHEPLSLILWFTACLSKQQVVK